MINNSELKSTLFGVMPFVLGEDEYMIGKDTEEEDKKEKMKFSL